MQGLVAYILSVTAAALIATIATRLLRDHGLSAQIGNVWVGLFLLLSLLRPLTDLKIPDLSDWHSDQQQSAAQAVAKGEAVSKAALAQRIKSQTEAYILNKAASLQVQLQVEVILSDDTLPVPAAVKLSGTISPYAKGQLQQILWQELGISKENQQWT